MRRFWSTLVISLMFPTLALATCPPPSGQRNTRIVQSGRGTIDQWPWFSALRLWDPKANRETFFCGASAIDNQWLVTAAHCLKEGGFSITMKENGRFEDGGGRRLQAVLGVDNLHLVRDENVFEIAEVVLHDKYIDAQTGGNDIALLKLGRPLPGPPIERAKVPEGSFSLAFRTVGFGAQSSNAKLKSFGRANGSHFFAMSEELKQITLVEADTKICKDAYSDTNASIGPGQLCAGLFWDSDDSCQGDSGGPLVVLDRQQCVQQVGIVSWGQGCGKAGRFGVYTRIAHYDDWIRAVIQNSLALQISIPPTLSDTQRALFAQIAVTLRAARGRLRVALSGPSIVPVGSNVIFTITSEVKGFLLLLDVDADGNVSQIFPNAFVNVRVPIQSNISLTVPDPSWGFTSFRATPPTGKGQIWALVMPEEFPYESLVGSARILDKGPRPKIVGGTSTDVQVIPITEQDRAAYMINLVHQINSIASNRGNDKLAGWGFEILDYEIAAR